jgi:hypothetical protein
MAGALAVETWTHAVWRSPDQMLASMKIQLSRFSGQLVRSSQEQMAGSGKRTRAQRRAQRALREKERIDEGSDSSIRRRMGSLLTWPRALAAAAVGAALTALAVGIAQDLFPISEIADGLRFGDAIGVTVLPFDTLGAVPGAASQQALDTAHWRTEIDGQPVASLPHDLPVVPAHSTTVLFELRGQRSSGVDIIGAQVRVLKREAAFKGSFFLGPGPQGANDGVVLQASLDDPVPRLTEADTGHPYFPGHHITLVQNESFPLTVMPKADHSFLQWDLAVQYVVAGRSATEYIGSGGVVHGGNDPHPFSITGLQAHLTDYRAVYTMDVQSPDLNYRLLTPDQYCAAEQELYEHFYFNC